MCTRLIAFLRPLADVPSKLHRGGAGRRILGYISVYHLGRSVRCALALMILLRLTLLCVVFSGLRIYAVSRNRVLGAVVLVLSLVPFGVDMVSSC